ncbi:MAG: methylenetetrahydrofolate reductase [Candidatus Methanomethylicota archaeon]|uniref:Methylenetetrahydrofolate reductase n=1 Tax=Thermoproteota archaeon TaxID=2056631 RepID=A0A520KEX6_9CREN|nr:MAG: methylenetetrahydrofolate reductase [Candidatus Verstraetearchaeota archaeon]TDA38151.1 MAG: methylenetetrahydrofolate reductase [Candidatus Verstraetearchaeota archaeon]
MKIFSNFMKELYNGNFVFTSEIEPKKSIKIDYLINKANFLKKYVIACNVTDNPRANAYLNSIIASYIIQSHTGLETICHMTVRDRNRIALISDILGASVLGIKNILVITGDHTTMGDNPNAMPVYDIDSTQFIKMLRKMIDEGKDINENPIDGKIEMHIGAVGNPNANPIEVELYKVERKIKAGAEFIQTQIVFDIEKIKNFIDYLKPSPPFILIGIFPCKSYRIAENIEKKLPGVKIPEEYKDKLKKAEGNSEKIDEINIEYFSNLIKEIKRNTKASGIHIMTIEYERIIGKIIDSL